MCRHSEDRQLPIGFCFSFPCTHTAIGEAIMVKLTKKFENDGLVGQDPAKGLQRALDRQKANVGSCNPFARGGAAQCMHPMRKARQPTEMSHRLHRPCRHSLTARF